MKINLGGIVSKLLHFLDRPSLRDCCISRNAKIGHGVHCIGVSMGKYSYMGYKNVVVNTTIGSYCSIASNCCIGGGSHPINMLSTSPLFYEGRNVFKKHFSHISYNEAKPVFIGNDVWVGEKVFIKDGITIGDGAIIGAHSVVTRDIPSYAIVAGVPAKIIRYRFDKETIDYLKETKWWLLPENKLKRFVEKINNTSISIDSIKDANEFV